MLKFHSVGVYSGSRDLLKFWEMSANIPETVQDRYSYNEILIGNHMSYQMAPLSTTSSNLDKVTLVV